MSANQCKTKIVATIGPASHAPRIVENLVKCGASVFRLNLSHGTHELHSRAIRAIRAASTKYATPVAIMADLQGPKIRTGKTAGDGPVFLRAGSQVGLTAKRAVCTTTLISIDYPGLIDTVPSGAEVLLDDGQIRLRVLKKPRAGAAVLPCVVVDGGVLLPHKGVSLPRIPLKIQSLTSKDRRDLKFVLAQDINVIALSFVRTPQDLDRLKSAVARSGKEIKVIAKLERPEALDHLPGILDRCDGVMVARGDLGVETSLWEVPILQKRCVAEANERGKLVIVATQMLESMIGHSSPTRAETTDIANAIIDGTDAVMLSGETAVGAYPVKAVEAVSKIARATEASDYSRRDFVNLSLRERYPPHAICEAAEWASRDLGGVPVCVFTRSGDTALYLSKLRTQAPIYAFSPSRDVVNTLALAWNVRAFHAAAADDLVAVIREAEGVLLRGKFVKPKELIVVITGTTYARGATNMLRIKRVGVD